MQPKYVTKHKQTTIIEQISYLLFLKNLDDIETNNENTESLLGVKFERIFDEEDKKILGIIGYYVLFDDAQVTTIAVLKEARGKSIASKMMNAMIDDCNSMMCSQLSLEVRKSNQKAINLYKKFDFIEMNIRKAYYEDGEDAIFMMRALGGNYD